MPAYQPYSCQTNHVTALSIPAKSYQPRPYQQECITNLAEARKQGIKKGLVVMASGLGKTLTTTFDLLQFFDEIPNAHVLYLCDKESILLQSKTKFQQVFGEEYSYGMFTSTRKTTHTVNFLFATFQTMREHRKRFFPEMFDYVVVDEAHHTSAQTYQPTADYFTPQFLLGLTATKNRSDGQDILDTYGQILYQMDIFDGWAKGYLAQVDYRIMLDDLNEAEFQKYIDPESNIGKISIAQLNRTIFAPMHDQGIVESIREQTADLDNHQTFVFCSNIDHANAMAELFGGEAAVIHSKQSYGQNQAILENFRAGNIRTIISVNMLNEGIDVPEADVVVFLRSTEVESVFFQQLGRGLRIIGNKRTVRVLDYVANLERIATILEMEETAKKRIQASPNYSNTSTLAPIIVNIPATKFRVRRVDVERLLKNITKYRVYSDQELLDSLRQKSIQLGGHMPTKEEIDADSNMASSVTYVNRFGGLGVVARLIGLKPNRADSYADNDLIAFLKEKAQSEGKDTLKQHDIRSDPTMPDYGTFVKRFGSFNNALELAGLKKSDFVLAYTDDELIAAYVKKSEEYAGEAPTTAEVDADPTMPHASTYFEHFGSWGNLRRISGLKPRSNCRRWQDASDQEILKALVTKTEQNDGYTPTAKMLDEDPTMPGFGTIVHRFGSLKKALQIAGLTEKHRPRKPSTKKKIRQYDVDTLRLLTQDYVRQHRRRLKVSDFTGERSLPSRNVYKRVFGSGTMDQINALIGADQIIAELETEE